MTIKSSRKLRHVSRFQNELSAAEATGHIPREQHVPNLVMMLVLIPEQSTSTNDLCRASAILYDTPGIVK